MSAPQESSAGSPLARHLHDALARVEAGNYKDALSLLKEAKALEGRNIYVLAFEKQVEQLIEFADLRILTEDQRSDIVDSLPGIIERALESAPGDYPREQVRTTSPTETERIQREGEEKSAALEWLKNQYFQHAHEYVRKGEYTHALAEIRRVYIIDPSNRIARDFERQIEQLISLRKVQTIPKGSQRQPFVPAATPPQERTAVILPAPRPVRSERPAEPAPPPRKEAPAAMPREKKRFSTAAIIAIVLALIALAAAAYFFLGRKPPVQPATPPGQPLTVETSPTEGTFTPSEGSLASLEAAEQSYTVSPPGQGGNLQVTPDGPSPRPSEATAFEDFRPAEEKATRPSGKANKGSREPSSPTRRGEGAAGGNANQNAAATPVETDPRPGSTQIASGGSITEEARIIRLERPRFADDSFAAGLEGQVVVQVEIDRDGRPRQTRILRSTNDLLDASVVEAVNKSEFSPRRTSEGPVNSWMTIPFTFRQRK